MLTLQIAIFLVYVAIVAVPFAVLVPGYLAWLRWRRPSAVRREARMPPTAAPDVDVLVPLHDEAEFIARKLADLTDLADAVGRVRILLVDGGSTDGTGEFLVANGGVDPRFTVIRTPTADKTHQLNVGLQRSNAPWVVVTDADARLPADTLQRLIAVGEGDADTAVVGATVIPERAHPLERLHWGLSNLIRRHESDCGAASLVAGPCYAFRRTLLDRFPDDVVADDIYVALVAAAAGKRVVLADVQVTEQRSPVDLAGLFKHKLRKTDAYLREIFRFLPQVRRMSSPARTIFLWRAAHLTVVPVLTALGVLGAALALSHPGLTRLSQLVLPLVASLVFAASWWGFGRRSTPGLLLAHGALLAVVTLLALVAYPFSRQTASFPKVAKRGSA